jgi:hypothetical protein
LQGCVGLCPSDPTIFQTCVEVCEMKCSRSAGKDIVV